MTSVGDRASTSTSALANLRPSRSVLPLIAVGGSRGKSTVASILEMIVRAAGCTVGSWISSGVYVDGEQLKGELGPWSRVLLAAKYGELDAVIQELEAAVVVGAGLPNRTYPLAVMTTICGNDESCRLSMSTELEERSIHMLAEAVREDGRIIANADDLSIMIAAQSSPADRMLYALHPDNPVLQRHLSEGGQAVWVVEGVIVAGDRDRFDPIVAVSEVPATLDGSFIFQIQNAMAATAAAIHLGIDAEIIASTLRTFEPDAMSQPGACNILEYRGGRIVVDSPRQTWTLKMLARGVKHHPHRRTIVVSNAFNDQSLSDAREVGRILGGLGGVVILHGSEEDAEQIKAIKAGIASNHVPPLVVVLGSEQKALQRLKTTIGAGDSALVLSTQPEAAIDILTTD